MNGERDEPGVVGVVITLTDIYKTGIETQQALQAFISESKNSLQEIKRIADVGPQALEIAENAQKRADAAFNLAETAQKAVETTHKRVTRFIKWTLSSVGAIALTAFGGWAQNHFK